MARRARPWYWKARDRWCVTIAGERIPLAEGKANKAAAEKRFHELMVAQAANPGINSTRQTIASVIDAYLVNAERRLSRRHYDHQKSALEAFAEEHGRLDVQRARPIHLTHWLAGKTAWKSPWTIYRVIGAIKQAFAWAADQELIPESPFRKVPRTAGGSRRPVTSEEFQAMMRGAGGSRGKTFRQALVFLRFTGCRPGEMASLKWTDVDVDRGLIVMKNHKTAKQQKAPKPRVVPLVPVVVKLLIYRRKRSTGEFVFLNAYGNPWHRSALALRIGRCRERQGIAPGATLYGVRHSFGTQAIMRGVDLATLAQLMGHTSTRMTEHYLHLAGEHEHLERSMRQATDQC